MPEAMTENFLTSIGNFQNIEAISTVIVLADSAFKHQIILNNETTTPNAPAPAPTPYIFNTSTESRYDDSDFKGLLIDLGTATRSTGGIGQLKALQRIDNLVKLDGSMAESANFIFGIGSTASIGTAMLKTPLGPITFHIVQVNILFLLCLADMDKLGAFFNNLTNQIIQNGQSPPVICRYGHAFLLWHISAYSIATKSLDQNPCFLTDVELRRLHRRFGHP